LLAVELLEGIACLVIPMKNRGTDMTLRDFVTFNADFPDDAQWDKQGNLLVPGGQTIAESLRKQLQATGFTCSDIFQHCDYGWTFDVVSDNIDVWCLLAAAEDGWVLMLEREKSIMGRLLGTSDNLAFEGFQDKVHEILTGDSRFIKVLWYSRKDYNSGKGKRGSAKPR
jgi:hypothetical protein